jgi:glycosyltransferase involved in cell wall biosynthesis
MKISIVTVTYNSAQTISNCIESVNNQTYPEIEHVIIDGAFGDETIAIIKSLTNRVVKIISEPDEGIYDAMNKGINLCSGDVIGLLNSDDIYSDEAVLTDVMSYFNAEPDLDIVYGNLVYVKKFDTNEIVRKWNSKSYYSSFFEHGNVPPHPALFLRSSVYSKVGLFDLKYKLAADYEFMFRVFKKHNLKSKYISRLTVKMRLGGATNKSIKNIFNGNKEILNAWKNNGFKPPITLMFNRFIKRIVQFF